MNALTGDAAVWYLLRGSGVVSLLLLTGVMALGIATRGGVRLGSMPRFATMALHRSVSLLAVVFVAVHVAAAVVDPFAQVRLVDVVVPFGAASQPLMVGLGALSLDVVLALLVTGALRGRIGRRAWRAIHWTAYAAWPLALAHSLGMGSDAGTGWMRLVAVASVVVVGGAIAWRVLAPSGTDAASEARWGAGPAIRGGR